MGVQLTCDHRVEDLAAERDEGGFDAVFVAVGAHLAKRVDIPAGDAATMVDAVSFLRSVASGDKPSIGRHVAVYGGGNTAMDAARVARRLGADDAVIVYRRTREQMPAHDEEAEDAEREGVRINWLRTITAFDGPELQVEVMELDESGYPRPTGRFETLAADTLIMALGQETESAFMRTLPGVEFDADGSVRVSESLMTGCPGVFAGGDMVPSERTVTVGVGHGKKAAHRIDAWLRDAPAVHAGETPDGDIRLAAPVVLRRRAQRRQPELDPAKRVESFEEVVGGLSMLEASLRSRALPVVRQLLRMRRLPRRVPGGRGDQTGGRAPLQVRLRQVHRLWRLRRSVPGPRHRHVSGADMTRVTVDGNEAAVSVAYRLNEVCCIYPITPSSPMAELADVWSSAQRTNVWGTVPTVVEMQSEGGAAGALHGALQSGALTTTFTSSQGLLLMIPNMYKIAGELTSAVINVAARSVAAQALSIFGDHSDVMAVRQTGFAMLASASVQEAHDLALIAQAATLATRVPFVHFFDGFRTSHELNTIETLTDDDLRALVPEELVRAHRGRALSPERPFIRGTAQNPDVYFQARETVNPFYARVPGVVEDLMAQLGERTGRTMSIVDYTGHPEAERVLVLMGSGAETVVQTVAALVERGERVGVVQMRLYRPFPTSGAAGGAAGDGTHGRCAGPHQGARVDRRTVVSGRRRGARRGAFRRRTTGDAAHHRWTLRPVLEGVHPRHGRRRVRRTRTRATAAPFHHRYRRRRLRDQRRTTTRRSTSSHPTRSGRSSSGSDRTEPSARTRTPSRSWGPKRACTPRGTSSTTRRNRARRPSRTCGSGRIPSGPPTSSMEPISLAAISSGSSTRSTC